MVMDNFQDGNLGPPKSKSYNIKHLKKDKFHTYSSWRNFSQEAIPTSQGETLSK